jgi:hypothetical protein
MSRLRSLPLAVLAAALAAGPAAAGPTVTMDAATQRRVAVATAPLEPARRSASVRGFAKVLDPDPLENLDADIAQAAAAAAASGAELKRARILNRAEQTISDKALEAADAQARADAAKLALLRRRVGIEWGAGIAGLSDQKRSAMLALIAGGRAALVRIDTPSGRGQSSLRTADIDLGEFGRVRAQVLGPARTADTQLQSPGLIALASGPGAGSLSSGLVAPVDLAIGAAASGVILPRSALIRAEGQTWVYVRRSATSFERRAVVGAAPDAAGLFAAQGVAAGEQVVVSGASALYTAEGHAAVGDDSD